MRRPFYRVALGGELAVLRLMRRHNINAVKMHHQCPFDLVVNGWRVEVKTAATPTKSGSWTFTIRRNGVLDESRVDVYVLRLENFPIGGGRKTIHLIVPAPLNKGSVSVRPGTFKKRWAKYCGSLAPIGKPSKVLEGQ